MQMKNGLLNYNNMTIKEFIEEISLIKPSLQDKEIVIKTPNGMLVEPKVRFIMKDEYDLQIDAEHVDKIIITYK